MREFADRNDAMYIAQCIMKWAPVHHAARASAFKADAMALHHNTTGATRQIVKALREYADYLDGR